MPTRWSGPDADAARAQWGAAWGDDVAELVYASRLIGSDPALVQAGGGNTSLKRDEPGPASAPVRALWVKGSGRDLADVGPDGFAPLDLARLLPLTRAESVADDALLATLATAALRPGVPFPSVETLLHAVVPDRAVVHAHAEAVLVLSSQPRGGAGAGGGALLEDALGPAFVVLPYVKPGHGLARAAAEALRGRPDAIGLVFRHHGIFAWGPGPREATERLLDAVEACRALVADRGAPRRAPHRRPRPELLRARDAAAALAPHVRGALAVPSGDPDRPWRQVVLASRVDDDVLDALAAPGAAELHARGPLTPDHLIRVRHRPVFVDVPVDVSPIELRARLDAEVAAFEGETRARAAEYGGPEQHDARPRVVLVPGVGLFAGGFSAAEAEANADIAARALAARAAAERLGRFEPLSARELAETEFWPPEQEKLRRTRRPALAGRVALVTGGAGAIGAGVARALAERGARVIVADRPGVEHAERLAHAVAEIGAGGFERAVSGCPFDVTDPADVARAFAEIALAAGGVDLLVLSHGAALVGEIAALDPGRVRAIFEINALGSFHVMGAFVRMVQAQGTGGDVVLVSTKNVPEPGASFGAYSASKAAAHQLGRVAAIELAPLGVRVNMVSPDAVFGDAGTPSLLWQTVGTERAKSRGIDPATLPEQYRLRNLLKLSVTAQHCAEAVLFFVERRTPTTGAVLPVDGGLPGSFPR